MNDKLQNIHDMLTKKAAQTGGSRMIAKMLHLTENALDHDAPVDYLWRIANSKSSTRTREAADRILRAVGMA